MPKFNGKKLIILLGDIVILYASLFLTFFIRGGSLSAEWETHKFPFCAVDLDILQRRNVRLGTLPANQKILYFAAGNKNHGGERAHRNHTFLLNPIIRDHPQDKSFHRRFGDNGAGLVLEE